MAEISLLADKLKELGLSPADLVAIGAGLTAGAVAAIAAKEALVRVNMTADQRLAKAEQDAEMAKMISDESQQWAKLTISFAEKVTAGVVTGGYSTVLSAQRPTDD